MFSAMASTVALALYPYTVTKKLAYHVHQFGYGYGLAWAATGLLYIAALTMMLDEVIRESTRPRLENFPCFRNRNRRQQRSRYQAPEAV